MVGGLRVRVFLLAFVLNSLLCGASAAEEEYRLLHYDRMFQNQDCVGNLTTAICALESRITCRRFREPKLCEKINFPHYGWFKRPSYSESSLIYRPFYLIREHRPVAQADISRLKNAGFKRVVLEGDTLIRIQLGMCMPDNECMKRVREYSQDLPERTGCTGWFDCSTTRRDDHIYILRKKGEVWKVILYGILPNKFSGTSDNITVDPLQHRKLTR